MDFPKLILLFTFIVGSTSLLASLFEVYFFSIGLSLDHIILSTVCLFIPPAILIFFFKEIKPRSWIILSIILTILSSLLLIIIKDPNMLYVARLLIGIAMFFFWIPFNIIYYELRSGNNAFLGSLYYASMLCISLIIPGLAGLIVVTSGYDTLFFISIFFSFFSIPVTYIIIRDDPKPFHAIESITSVSALAPLLFIEGFSIHGILHTLAVMVLSYFKDPLEFGFFLSGVTGFSIIASLLFSKLSDKAENRKHFLFLSGVGFFLASISTYFARDAALFFIGFGAINFARSLLAPIALALVVDKTKNLSESFIGREFYLNTGRIIAIIMGFVLLIFFDIYAMLLLQSLVAGLFLLFIKDK